MKIREVKELIGDDLLKNVDSIHRHVLRSTKQSEVSKRAYVWINVGGPQPEEDRQTIVDIIEKSGMAPWVKIDFDGTIEIRGFWWFLNR